MNVDQMNEYGEKLCEDIKRHYLNDYCANNGNWLSLCQESIKNYVLSRSGWLKSDNSADTFMFNDKYPLTVNILYSGSPGTLLINTTIGIAKAELVDGLIIDDNNNLEEGIVKIEKCIRSQDWIIPFVRKTSQVKI